MFFLQLVGLEQHFLLVLLQEIEKYGFHSIMAFSRFFKLHSHSMDLLRESYMYVQIFMLYVHVGYTLLSISLLIVFWV